MSTIRLLLAIALQKDWNIIQLDIPSTFLNGKLESEVYIYAPAGLKSKPPILKQIIIWFKGVAKSME